MEKKIFKVAILGAGARGGNTYGRLMNEEKDKFSIVAICDQDPEKLNFYADLFGVKQENRFLDEDEFFKEKRADALVIGTPDACHTKHALRAFEKGYDILVEKPLTDKREECEALLAAQKKYGGKAMVCHVLRYAPAFLKVAEIIDGGQIGRLVAMNATEQVAYWHQAHSYVRGNWRRREDTTPMILAKCCHDLDYLQYYAKSPCVSVSSVGDLTYFTADNAPMGATKRCVDCPHVDTCAYSAKRFYVDNWENGNQSQGWPYNVLVIEPVTKEKLVDAVENGPYGRCVFHCDNDVVDHQITQMTFANGVKATLTMTAFTANGGRIITFHGTEGQLILNEEENLIHLKRFGQPEEIINLAQLSDNGYGHGGGDYFLIQQLYKTLSGEGTPATALTASVESHLIGIAAEESRLLGGALIPVHTEK